MANVPADWFRAAIGGVLIGVSALALLTFNGRILGVSGIVGGLFKKASSDRVWRLCFLAGLLLTAVIVQLLRPSTFTQTVLTSPFLLVISGLLVGVGTALSGGCTSGHGVCGMGRFSLRSVVATLVFMGVGMATVAFIRFGSGL